MGVFNGSTKVVCTILAAYIVSATAAYNQQKHSGYDMSWPVTIAFHESKTNALLGEEILRRLYARIGFTDNIIRAEIDTMYENLKELIDKKLRRCERRRRREGSPRSFSHDQYNPYQVNASLAHQYAPRRTTKY